MKQELFKVELLRDSNVIDTRYVYEFNDDCIDANLYGRAIYEFENIVKIGDVVKLFYNGHVSYVKVSDNFYGIVAW